MKDNSRLTLDDLTRRYAERNPRSRQLYQRARETLPGGNTRTGVNMAPFPFYADAGKGAYLTDVDGHRLLDFVNNQTALILGHAAVKIGQVFMPRWRAVADEYSK